MEKKKLKINTALCDARNVTEEVLKAYESVEINAGLIVVSKESKELLSRYNVSMNAASIEEAPADMELILQNGKYEISDSTNLAKTVMLVVNGTLDIKTKSEKVLEKFHSILVNGKVSYSSDIEEKLPNINVNGATEVYPADAIRLKSKFILDKTFILRAERAKYFAKRKVIILDENLDIDSLVEKQAQFITKRAIIAEELLERSLPLFDPEVEIEVISAGYNYIGSETLRDRLIRKYGDSLYVDGDLIIDLESEKALDDLKNIKVRGTVYILERLKDKFYDINSDYDDMKNIKGIVMGDKPLITVDSRLLRKHREGITIIDCAAVSIKDDVTPDEIEEKLQFIDCASIHCSPEQKSAVEAVSEDVPFIDDNGKFKGVFSTILEGSGLFDKDTKVVNAAKYTM